MGDPNFPWPDDPRDQLIAMLMRQNAQLIEALTKSNPVEVIRALNPPAAPSSAPIYTDPWSGDEGHTPPAEDPWGDPTLRPEQVIPGWTTPPFNPEPYSEEMASDGTAPTPE